MDDINRRIIEIIDEMVSDSRLAAFGDVVGVLLDRYNCQSIQQLLSSILKAQVSPVGPQNVSFLEIEVLRWLWNVECRMNTYLEAYLMTHSIISLLDIDFELGRYVKSFGIPQLTSLKRQFCKTDRISVDPNEIVLDSGDSSFDGQSENSSWINFSDFGLGDIIHHKLLKEVMFSQFNAINFKGWTRNRSFITLHEVYIAILKDNECDTGVERFTKKLSITADSIVELLCKYYKVKDLLSLGICLNEYVMKLRCNSNAIEMQFENELMRYLKSNPFTLTDHISHQQHSRSTKRQRVERFLKNYATNRDQSSSYDESSLALLDGHENHSERPFKCLGVVVQSHREHLDDEFAIPGEKRRKLSVKSINELNKNDSEDLTSADIIEILKEYVSTDGMLSSTSRCDGLVKGFNFDGKLEFQKIERNYGGNAKSIIVGPWDISAEELANAIPFTSTHKMSSLETGRWGEALVYQYLSQKYPLGKVQWLNVESESRASYDIILTTKLSDTREVTTFIEVKTTKSNDFNVFELSLFEWQFASALPRVNYHIYRVFGAGEPKACRITVIPDILAAIQEGSAKLCIAV